MTPQERARKVVEEVREHKMFNVDTDGTWERYIASAIKCALEDSLPSTNDLDEVVHELGIEDSDTTPAEEVRALKAEAANYCSSMQRWSEACRRAGVCMSCATGELGEPCHDCLGTGWNGGAPTGYVSQDNVERLYQENGALRKLNASVREYQDFLRRSTNVGPVTNGPHKEARLLRAMYEAAANAHAIIEGQPEGCR